jgi:hypothetical protein
MTRPVCVHCGAKYGQRHTHDVTLRWAEGEPEPRYEGNLIVVKEQRTGATPATTIPRWAGVAGELLFPAKPNVKRLEVWNGKSWYGGYEPFCTLRCALSYARKAYAARGTR